jgi:8-oxo-dGTP pyrophosphatase MutT (NUDIX family)
MAHYHYSLDLCVDTFVVNDGAVLLRMHDKYNFWGSLGGHIDPGEDVNEAALREVKEEAGLEVELVGPPGWERIDSGKVRDLVPPLFVNRHPITETHDHSSFVFVARATTRTINPYVSESPTVEFKWCTQVELDELLRTDARLNPDTHRYASAALRVVR